MTLNLQERHTVDIQTEEEPSFGDSPVKLDGLPLMLHHDPIKREDFQVSSPTKIGPKTPPPLMVFCKEQLSLRPPQNLVSFSGPPILNRALLSQSATTPEEGKQLLHVLPSTHNQKIKTSQTYPEEWDPPLRPPLLGPSALSPLDSQLPTQEDEPPALPTIVNCSHTLSPSQVLVQLSCKKSFVGETEEAQGRAGSGSV